MNVRMRTDYAAHVLRRDWKGAVQILKAALELDTRDKYASRQLAELRNRFLQEANHLISEARILLADINDRSTEALIDRFDRNFPEWTEFADADGTLRALWAATRENATTVQELLLTPSGTTQLTNEEIREARLRELLDKAHPDHLANGAMDDLRILERKLEDAQLGFALGSNSDTISEREVSIALASVRTRMKNVAKRAAIRKAVLGLLAVTLVFGVTRFWLLPQSDRRLLTLELCNPQPSEGDFVLPMPSNGNMTFRPISRGERREHGRGEAFLEFARPGLNESKARVYFPFQVGEQRVYYLGKYEVSEGQFQAIVKSSSARREIAQNNDNSTNPPARSLSLREAQQFCAEYTEWLHKYHLDMLPKTPGGQIAIVLLPLSDEWEFAARGGNKTFNGALFAQRYPYQQELNRFEWFGGPLSSHNHVHSIGQLKPNPVGCHDILGNVREITRRSPNGDAYVDRGGYYGTPEAEMSAASETEHPDTAPFYGGPFRHEQRGFRVALGTSQVDWQIERSAGPGAKPEESPRPHQ